MDVGYATSSASVLTSTSISNTTLPIDGQACEPVLRACTINVMQVSDSQLISEPIMAVASADSGCQTGTPQPGSDVGGRMRLRRRTCGGHPGVARATRATAFSGHRSRARYACSRDLAGEPAHDKCPEFACDLDATSRPSADEDCRSHRLGVAHDCARAVRRVTDGRHEIFRQLRGRDAGR